MLEKLNDDELKNVACKIVEEIIPYLATKIHLSGKDNYFIPLSMLISQVLARTNFLSLYINYQADQELINELVASAYAFSKLISDDADKILKKDNKENANAH